jgi:hypothetical protein
MNMHTGMYIFPQGQKWKIITKPNLEMYIPDDIITTLGFVSSMQNCFK